MEDEHATFDLHAERKGFHFFNGSVWFFKVKVKLYLTNYRVRPLYRPKISFQVIFIPFGKDKSKSPVFSVCLESLRNARAVDIPFNESDHYISFEVSVEHGADLTAVPSDMSRTIRDVLAEVTNQEVMEHEWESCEVLAS